MQLYGVLKTSSTLGVIIPQDKDFTYLFILLMCYIRTNIMDEK